MIEDIRKSGNVETPVFRSGIPKNGNIILRANADDITRLRTIAHDLGKTVSELMRDATNIYCVKGDRTL